MEGNILNLDKIKVSYPFLKDNRGNEKSLADELQYLVGYLLIADIVVVPPREFLGGTYGNRNINFVNKTKLLTHLINTGKIITTSSSLLVRDSIDLIEHYGIGKQQYDLKFYIYERDSDLQKKAYRFHMQSHISNVKYYSNSIKHELVSFLNHSPDHLSVMKKINYLKKRTSRGNIYRLNLEASHAYFSGGSIGNGAIMPSMYTHDRKKIIYTHDGEKLIYNPFYSKEVVNIFLYKIQVSLKKQFHKTPPHLADKILNNLQIFRLKYYELAKAYETFYTKILKLLEKGNAPIRRPTTFLYITVALAISGILSDFFTKEIIFDSVFAACSAKFFWAYLNKTMKITDCFSKQIQSYLKFTGMFDDFRGDLITLTEEFEYKVEKSITY